MARAQSRYVCQSCGASVLRWEGQCRTCGEWNTLVETVVREEPRRPSAAVAAPDAARSPCRTPTRAPSNAVPWASASSTGCSVAGCRGLRRAARWRAGDRQVHAPAPVAAGVARGAGDAAGGGVLYATGEESTSQVRIRAARLGLTLAAPPATRSGSSPRPRSAGSWSWPAASARRCCSWTRSRPWPRTSSTARPGAWARCGRPRCG